MKIRNNKYLKVALLVLTLAAFVYYFLHNQEQFSKIGDLTWWQILLIILGQSLVFFSNILVLIIFVRFLAKRIPFIDSARITAYSSLINFFGFLQGGVGLRGLYLKRQFDMSVKRYIALTSIQYLILFGISGIFLIIGLSFTTGIAFVALLALAAAVLLAVLLFILHQRQVPFVTSVVARIRTMTSLLQAKPLLALVSVIILQLCGSLLANAVELQSIGAHVTIGGLLIYTGISQFAIVIALTPGAIGIREALLLIVQGQMHLSTQSIVVASTIDRLVYFITLALVTPLALSAKKKIGDK